jgi:23S rRNA pseudoU1915 N3-methylase RlmH
VKINLIAIGKKMPDCVAILLPIFHCLGNFFGAVLFAVFVKGNNQEQIYRAHSLLTNHPYHRE